MKTALYSLVLLGSLSSIGFGVWHLFVPGIWHWYSYMRSDATELVLAVRAINVFFSVSLILFGLVNAALVLGNRSNAYSMAVVLGATTALWLLRVVMQVVYPQGTINPALRYGMLAAFVVVLLCHLLSLAIVLKGRPG